MADRSRRSLTTITGDEGSGAMRYEGRVAVVTGAASGIGAETARLLVDEGGSVVVADVLADRAEEVAAALGERAV